MTPEYIHFTQEMVAGAALSSATILCVRLGSVRYTEYRANLCLLFLPAIATLLHGALAISGLVGDIKLFIPKTWFVSNVLTAIIVFVVVKEPEKIDRYLAVFVFLIVVVFTWVIMASDAYYWELGPLGRPFELIPFALNAGTLRYLRKSKRTFGNSGLVPVLGSVLGVGMVMSLVMAFSHDLFDPEFVLAHLAKILMCLLLLNFAIAETFKEWRR